MRRLPGLDIVHFLQQSLHKTRWSRQSRDREAPETLSATAPFARVRSFACRGRLRNLLADCCTLGLYCVTITRQ